MPSYSRPPTFDDNLDPGAIVPTDLYPVRDPVSSPEVYDAMFATENTIGSTMLRREHVGPLTKPVSLGFDYLTGLPESHVGAADYFKNARSQEELDMQMSLFDAQAEQRRVISEAPGIDPIVFGIAVGLQEPLFAASLLLPAGIFIRGMQLAKPWATVARGAATTAGIVGTESAAQEAVLHRQQAMRTGTESGINIAASMLLGSLFTGIPVYKGLASQRANIASRLDAGIHQHLSQPPLEPTAAGGSVGAYAPDPLAVGAGPIEGERAARGGRFWKGTPLTRIVNNSRSSVALAAAEALAETPIYRNKNIPAGDRPADFASFDDAVGAYGDLVNELRVQAKKDGIDDETFNAQVLSMERNGLDPSEPVAPQIEELSQFHQTNIVPWYGGVASRIPMEAQIKVDYARAMAPWQQRFDESFKELKEAGEITTRVELDTRIARALRREDQDELGNETISAMAADYRAWVLDPPPKRLVAGGFAVPEQMQVSKQYAPSYFPRLYDIPKLHKEYGTAVEDIATWIYRDNLKKRTEVSMADARQIVIDSFATIMREPSGRVASPIFKSERTLKERTFKVPDEILEPYLVNDTFIVGDKFLGTYLPDIYLLEKGFGENGADVFARIDNQYQNIHSQMADEGKLTDELAIELRDQKIADVRDLEVMMERLKRMHTPPADLTRKWFYKNAYVPLKSLVFTASLGNVMLSSIPDYGLLAIQHGLGKELRVSAQHIARLFSGPEAKQHIQTLRAAGIGIEDMIHDRLYAFGRDKEFGAEGLALASEKVSNLFVKLSLIESHTNNAKYIAGTVIQDKYLNLIAKFKGNEKMTNLEIADLRRAGFTDDLIERIYAQREHWINRQDVLHPNIAKWTDAEAEHLFSSAVVRDVDSVIVTPGIGDLPNFVDSWWGNLLIQFQRFFYTTMSRTTAPMAQRWNIAKGAEKAQTANGILAAVMLGMMAGALREAAKGNTDYFEERNFGDWLKEGVDRSGVLGLIMEGYNSADKVSQNRISGALGLTGSSRYAGRASITSVLGPTAGYVEDLMALGMGVADMDLSPADLHKVRRLMPYQNLFYGNWLLSKGEERLQEALE